MDAIFGALHRDPRQQVSHQELVGVAQLHGNPSPIIESEPGFALAVNSGSLLGAAATSIAISNDRMVSAALLGEIERGDNLAREMAKAGLNVRTSTSAELVVQLFRTHGTSFVERLQGFFAIVLWDSSARRLLLYADRCAGMRTLYFFDGPDAFRFGSTARAVLAQPGVPRQINRRALDDLLTIAHPIAPDTLISGLQTIPAGCFLDVIAGQPPRLQRYWQRRPYKPAGEDLSALAERYFDALVAAVARNAGENDPVAVLLSGGVDSAAIVSLLRARGHKRICSYTLDSGDEDMSDRDAARIVADLFGTEHHVVELGGSASLDALPEIVWQHEAPGVHLHPLYCLSRAASREHQVVLGGYGNDLMWGTRHSHATPSAGEVADRAARYLRSRRRASRQELQRLLTEAAPTDLELEERIGRGVPQLDDPREDQISLDESLFGDQRIFRELGKTAVDAHSLWVTSPYCDSTVVVAAENVPIAARARKRGPGTFELKSFFKDLTVARGVLPAEIVHRPKKWVRPPIAQWLRGELGETIEPLILGGRARERHLFDLAYVRGLFDKHRTGFEDHSRLLTMLVSIELWFRLFIDPPVLSAPTRSLREYASEDR